MKFNGQTYNMAKLGQSEINQVYDTVEQQQDTQRLQQALRPQLELQEKMLQKTPQQSMSYKQLADLTKKVNRVNPGGFISQDDIARYVAIIQQSNNLGKPGNSPNVNNSSESTAADYYRCQRYYEMGQIPVNPQYPSYQPQYPPYPATQSQPTKRKFRIKDTPIPNFMEAFLVIFSLVIPTILLVKHEKGELPPELLSNTPQAAIIISLLVIIALGACAALIHNYDDDEIM